MATQARTLLEKLAAADPHKFARWTKDRILWTWNRFLWHAARLRMQAYEVFALRGKLPPGSLAASSSRNAHRDHRFYLKQLSQHGPIFKLFWTSGDLKVCIVGYPLARRLLNQHSSSLLPVAGDLAPLVPSQYLRAMDPEIHPHYRRLFMGALRNDHITACEPEIRRLIRDELNGLANPLPEESASMDLYQALHQMAMKILSLTVLGVRADTVVFPALSSAYHRLGPDGHQAPIGPEQKAAFPLIRDIVLKIVASLGEKRRAGFADSILSRLVSASKSDVDDTVIGNLIYMIERGRHDLGDLLRWILKHLSDNPSVAAELCTGPETCSASPGLAEACVLETLRLEQAEVLVRKATESFTLEGYHIPKGSWVCGLMRESHRDPVVFSEPDRYRPQRFLGRKYSTDEYAPFGIGEHQCIARFLAISVCTLFVEELVAGYTWSVVSDGPCQFGHFHWQPARNFSVELRPR